MPITNENQIGAYLHCGLCLHEVLDGKAPGESPATHARLAFGWTPAGLQVWCERHGCNVINIDFEGAKHPAVTTRKGDH